MSIADAMVISSGLIVIGITTVAGIWAVVQLTISKIRHG